MRALLQRVTEAEVSVVDDTGAEAPLAAIGPGLVVLICAEPADTEETAQYFARKVANMRMFEDVDGKTNLSIQDVGGEALVISQFTLAADWKKGNRPGFSGAADPATAERLYLAFVDYLKTEGVEAATGQFRSHMRVRLANDGPFTIWMDSD
ncbi:MAG: D-tyrosyl-tRNA(Tyr) deacylase [Rhodospirillaceae bacterium]|nr:D-tyrosyl-tRNA(Tyr) deacylase [Magnetovibrio sp.]MAY67424.1 D-tyrosyl-tRNA(Tyr) deacylase [Rhodospirillaceae bacterium]|tara:strand:- start:234 stop:689 length:456 start_codon:yes stop_codon:yes gene_type:complete